MAAVRMNWLNCARFTVTIVGLLLLVAWTLHGIIPLGVRTERDIGDGLPLTTEWQSYTELQALKHQMSQQCQEKHNFLYIKMIKCGSSTLTELFRRFGYTRNLSFVLPPDRKIYIGWPFILNDTFYRPNKTREFNMLVDHAVYNEDAMGKLMPNDTVYITSIRHPYSQFKSMFKYYRVGNIVSITSEDPITEYLSHLDKYEAIYKSQEVAKWRYCIPSGLSMAKNLMAFNLGFPTGFPLGSPDMSHDAHAIRKWLHHIENKFKLIMLVEYIDESLVLLKRLMCWKTKDIIYFMKNVGHYNYKHEVNYRRNIEIYNNFSNVDVALYEHFEYIFWKKVSEQGRGFAEEVDHFKQARQAISMYCDDRTDERSEIFFEATDWSEAFSITKDKDCYLLKSKLLDEVKLYYEKLPGGRPKPKSSVFVC